jgi:flagellar basal body-associated protein FliL
MQQEHLNDAYNTLQEEEGKRSKRLFWLMLGVIFSIIFIAIILILWVLRNTIDGSDSYPYIPTPRNTISSTSAPELLINLINDGNETAIKYSVFYFR